VTGFVSEVSQPALRYDDGGFFTLIEHLVGEPLIDVRNCPASHLAFNETTW